MAAPASSILLEHGLEREGDHVFGPAGHCSDSAPRLVRRFPLYPVLREGVLFDFIELGLGDRRWSSEYSKLGLNVYPRAQTSEHTLQCSDVVDPAIARELASLALRGVVREWHARAPCASFGALRRPRARSRSQPEGFPGADAFTVQQQTGCCEDSYAFSFWTATSV